MKKICDFAIHGIGSRRKKRRGEASRQEAPHGSSVTL